MRTNTPHPLKSTLLNLIHSCLNIKSFKKLHAQLVTSGLIQDSFVITKIIDCFARCDDLVYAHEIICQIHHHPSSFYFNTLIAGYASSRTPESAILVYKRMAGRGISPDMFTFPVILKSCAKLLGIGEGKQVHGVVVRMGFLCDVYVQNALVLVYGVCGECGDASKLFDEMLVRDVVSWNSLISGYVRSGSFREALSLFLKMDVEPNVATLVSIIVACGRLGYLEIGKGIHGLIFKHGLETGLVVGNSLVDMYMKCGCLDMAKLVFDQLSHRDIVSWTSLISGLVQREQPKEALEVFRSMQVSGVDPDKVTLASVLSACASLGALNYGRWVHEYIDRKVIEWDAHIGTSLVDMYAKCGCIDMVLHTFHGMYHKNISSWNALLGGLAMNGHGREALDHFSQMTRVGVRPNKVTFVAILSACSHSGLVEEGRWCFDLMTRVYNLVPRIEHYGCMVDLLGRAGFLDEAFNLMRTMPTEPDVLIWGAMLSACKVHGDVDLFQQILRHLFEFEAHDSGVYVLLSNIYAANDRWEDVSRVRRLMKDRGIKKVPGSSVLEVNGKTHEFLVGECNHPQLEEIHLMLSMLRKHVLEIKF